jgi:hypothetical protein
VTITEDDVQRLLDAQTDDSVLVLHEGRTLVLPAADLATDRYAGAFRLAARSDIVQEAGSETLSEHERKQIAARLDTEVSTLGG